MSDDSPDKVELPLRWRVHRIAEEPLKGVVAVLVILAAGVGAAVFMGSALWGVFAVAVLFVGLIKFFLPIEYAVDRSGIYESFLGIRRSASWRMFKRTVIVGREMLLSPYPRRRFIERFRAWQIRVPSEEVAELITELIHQND